MKFFISICVLTLLIQVNARPTDYIEDENPEHGWLIY